MALRKGFVHYATFPDPISRDDLLASIALIMDEGFEVLELSSRVPPAELEAGAGAIRRRGGTVFLSAGPEFVRAPRSLCDLDDTARALTIYRACELIDVSARIGAANLMLVSGADPGPEGRAAAHSALVASLQEIADYAKRHAGAPSLTLETFPRERAPGQLLGPTIEALALIRDVPGVGVTTDLSHLAQLGEDVAQSTVSLAARSTHIHLSTCVLTPGHPLEGDQHPSFDEPGIVMTLADAARALRMLPERHRVVSVEVRRLRAEAPASLVQRCNAFWNAVSGA